MVMWSFQIIGEATKKVSEQTRKAPPEIPWTYMARLRDKITHGYSGIDYEIVWLVVQDKIPVLEPKIRALLNS